MSNSITDKELKQLLREIQDNQSDQLAKLQYADDETKLDPIQYAYLGIVRERLRQTSASIDAVLNAIGRTR